MKQQRVIQTILGGTLLLSAALLGACEEETKTLPSSLEAPVKMAIARGEVCLPSSDREDGTISTKPLPACEDGERAGFGLIVNTRSDSVAVADLNRSTPRLVNLDARVPGVTHIRVGRRPVDIAVSSDGTAAVVAEQGEQTLTGIDLWTLRPLAEQVLLTGIPQGIGQGYEDEDGPRVVVVTSKPDQLSLLGGLRCERPDDAVDRRDYEPQQSCEWTTQPTAELELPGQPVAVETDAEGHRAWVIYRDLNALSAIALSEEGLKEGESCQGAQVEPPCEVAQISWDEGARQVYGATALAVDPLGLFVYVLDRPKSQLLVFDQQRNQLINASEAIEPPLVPFSTRAGIPLSASPSALAADVQRQVVESGEASMVRYFLGAQVAGDNGQLYQVGVVDLECAFEGEASLSRDELLFDVKARQESPEAACHFVPALPVGGDPDFDDDEELLGRRLIERDAALLAVNPVFALRDGQAKEGRIVGRAQCTHPEELVSAMRAEAGEGASLGCGSPLAPQPLAPEVDEELASFSDSPRAKLMTFARAILEGSAEKPEPQVLRQPFDLRLVNEQWTITYEGALPGVGASERGLVDRARGEVFLSGGVDFCAAAAEVGDRLTILSKPSKAEGCEVFEGEEGFLTYEIRTLGPYEVELALIEEGEEGDFVQDFPTRSCFDKGLRYEIRARQAWTVVGQQSGMSSPYERSGDECVLKEGAESGGLQGRVATGEEYLGPYLQMKIYPGQVEPVQGTEYIFQVERNFGLAAETVVPSSRDGSQSTVPAQVLFTPALSRGRYVVVVDSGANRIYLRNLERSEGARFLY